jgi:ABC-2 type transport system permease protein
LKNKPVGRYSFRLYLLPLKVCFPVCPVNISKEYSYMRFRPFIKTMLVEAAAPMDGGIMYFAGGYAVKLVRMLLLLGVWRSIINNTGAVYDGQAGYILQYTLLAAAFYEQLDVQTTASTTFWEGTVSSRYLRPAGIFGQYTAETVGRWLPGIFLFTLPVILLSPLLGAGLYPADPARPVLFAVSLLLGIASGFALDYIFTGLMVLLGNMHYFAYQIRSAVTVLLSGALIPLHLMPWGIGSILELLPFASMASAPLQIYTGTGDAVRLMLLQCIWCAILWVLAAFVWQKNRQRLVMFGG